MSTLRELSEASSLGQPLAAQSASAARRRRKPITVGDVVRHVLVVAAFIIVAFPLFWLVSLAFKTDADAFTSPPTILFRPSLIQFQNLFDTWPFPLYYRNSLIVLFGCLTVSIALALPLAYALARFRWRRKNDISFYIVSQLMLPPAAVGVPFYLLCEQLGILRTLWAPMLVYVTFALPFIAWIMKGFFESLPPEIEEAGLVDGAGRFQVLWYIVLPLSMGSLFSTTMLAVITLWNEFLFAFMLTGADTYTAPVGLVGLRSWFQSNWGQIGAGGLMIALPMVVVGFIVQRYLVRGLTFGAVK